MTVGKRELLLGKHTPVVEVYSPELLYPIPRSQARSTLGIVKELPFYGVDLWHAYELSWLDRTGKPVSRVGRFTIPCNSPNLIESKSFKLYLNSLNNTQFESDKHAKNCIIEDASAVAGAVLALELFSPDDPELIGHSLKGRCLDSLTVSVTTGELNAAQIRVGNEQSTKEEQLYSHLLRSLCPVTGQPDWATVSIHYKGLAIDQASLLEYIIAYRQHQEFHEQCVERMFLDIQGQCKPEFLHIQAFYTRRGGLDIKSFPKHGYNGYSQGAIKPLLSPFDAGILGRLWYDARAQR